MNQPKVSVLTPVYNGEKYLREMMDSIIAQTFIDFEWVIINDGSTDNTEQIIKSYTDNRIRYFANDKNIGIAKTYNRAIDLAKGKYLAIAEADDVNHPQRLEVSVNYLEKNLDIGVTSGRLLTFQKTTPAVKPLKITNKTKITSMQIKCDAVYYSSISIKHAAKMVRASVLAEHNLKYDEQYKICCDFALFLELAKNVKMARLRAKLVFYRWHGGNTSDSPETIAEANKILNRFYDKHFGLSLDIDAFPNVVDIECFTSAAKNAELILQTASKDKGYDYVLLRRSAGNFIHGYHRRMYASGVNRQAIFDAYKHTPLMRFTMRKKRLRIYLKHIAYKLKLIK